MSEREGPWKWFVVESYKMEWSLNVRTKLPPPTSFSVISRTSDGVHRLP